MEGEEKGRKEEGGETDNYVDIRESSTIISMQRHFRGGGRTAGGGLRDRYNGIDCITRPQAPIGTRLSSEFLN